ncbi:TM2 domain-containing protein [Deinococcus sp.]|uniref:TM2 domain-containing protein n=1 Tax=Deinococcus sp. TaxID=47478 RepID=UPI003B5C8C7A
MTQPDNDGLNLHKPRATDDLRIDPPRTPEPDAPDWVREATQQPQTQHPQKQPQPSYGTGQPSGTPAASAAPWNINLQGEIGTRKLVAGLLAIFLGGLGAHKFYLGRTGPGLLMLIVNLGGWFVTGVLSLITFGIGAIFLVPLMSFVAGVLVIVGLIEGVVYLTRSDADFQQQYLLGHKDWF